MVRALSALMHGDLAAAWTFHPFSFLLVGVVVASLLTSLVRHRAGRAHPVALSGIPLPALALVAVAWLAWGAARALDPPAWA